jgi:hypothetical protein
MGMTKEQSQQVLKSLNKLTLSTRKNIIDVIREIEQAGLEGYVNLTFYGDMSGDVNYEDYSIKERLENTFMLDEYGDIKWED